jgi:hypothetical protein
MRPVRVERLPDIRDRREFLLLNTALLWLVNLRAAPARVGGPTGAPPLPVELWARILALVNNIKPAFVPVVISRDAELVDAGDGVVRVTLVERMLSHYDDGLTGETISAFEKLLHGSPRGTRRKGPTYTFENTAAPTPQTFAVTVPAEYTRSERKHRTRWDWLPSGVLLFEQMRHADCHARLGWDAARGCRMCGRGRFICPGCTGGMADEYDVFMGCGAARPPPGVRAAADSVVHRRGPRVPGKCRPLQTTRAQADGRAHHCLGYEVSGPDKDYNETYYHDLAPEEHERARRQRLVAALCALGLADGRGWAYRDPVDDKKELQQSDSE